MKKNNGFTLLEVLISMLLLVVIGLGGAYLLGRANYIQRDMNIHLLTVSQMRNALQNGSCASNSSVTLTLNSNATKTATCNSYNTTYTVNVPNASGLTSSLVTVTYQTIAEPNSASNPITVSP